MLATSLAESGSGALGDKMAGEERPFCSSLERSLNFLRLFESSRINLRFGELGPSSGVVAADIACFGRTQTPTDLVTLPCGYLAGYLAGSCPRDRLVVANTPCMQATIAVALQCSLAN